MTAGFDVHEVRHRVKLLRDDGDTMLIENRKGVACPACGDTFSQLLISERPAHSFDIDADTRFCVRREDERMLIATHE
ncbi:flagella cluster protein [Haloferax sp. MBLA0076]|uniref:Flagella cluster protein n=1 Tax=Haloferax litoreum TaxID=2666140 RepID=A0A6A8GHY4_9EURY|nr:MULTISPECIES: flagella cluster protein [Haloferax]KAB1193989.1 flagella cluster protein [Haloferax sp. CBA1148]MRX22536.1 flagella cluster protein [Haloferax litoreum]